MQIQGQSGIIIVPDGQNSNLRQDRMSGLVTADGMPRYTEAAFRGQIFGAAMPAVAALSVNSGTATGLILTNPSGSQKILSLIDEIGRASCRERVYSGV